MALGDDDNDKVTELDDDTRARKRQAIQEKTTTEEEKHDNNNNDNNDGDGSPHLAMQFERAAAITASKIAAGSYTKSANLRRIHTYIYLLLL